MASDSEPTNYRGDGTAGEFSFAATAAALPQTLDEFGAGDADAARLGDIIARALDAETRRFLATSEHQAAFADWLRAETGCPRLIAVLGVKALAGTAVIGGGLAIGAAGGKAARCAAGFF